MNIGAAFALIVTGYHQAAEDRADVSNLLPNPAVLLPE